ncbi:MAG: NADH-quinone oxidoreductase subunit NuoE [Chloroflexota bacterium]
MLVSEKNALTEEIERLSEIYGEGSQALLPILQEIQIKHGYVSDYAHQEIARVLGLHPVEVYGVVSFYAFLRANHRGRYVVRLCKTISCDLESKDAVARAIERELGIKFGETTHDEKFTLEYANCMGMCDKGPAMLINDQVYTNLTPRTAVDILKTCK